jgi:16S rRNA (cytidine1402-2'-O)-methyltransferase
LGTLYLVATPIGNLEDITLRALRVLGEVALIAAEDTRLTGRMLQHYDIERPLVSFHGDSPPQQATRIIDALAEGDVAVVSDAGMPGISDPGARLVQLAVERGYPVIPIPGPSSVTAVAAASGAVDEGYIFAGFLPRKAGERRKRLQELAALNLPIIIYESPRRITSLLDTLNEELPEADVTVGREITKLHEEWLRGTPSDVLDRVTERGEFTLVVVPNRTPAAREDRLDETLRAALSAGETVRAAVDLGIAATGLPRKVVYRRALEIQSEG